MTNKIAVVGSGSWGTALAILLADKGNEVKLWSYFKEESEELARFRENKRFLPGVKLPDNIECSSDLEYVMSGCRYVVSASPSKGVVSSAEKMAEFYDFFEIYPPRNQEDKKAIEMVLELSRAFHVPVVATSCALSLSALDEEKRLEEMKIKFPYYKSENHFLRSTDEVLKEFSFLGEDIAYDIVIKNPTLIANRIETY